MGSRRYGRAARTISIHHHICVRGSLARKTASTDPAAVVVGGSFLPLSAGRPSGSVAISTARRNVLYARAGSLCVATESQARQSFRLTPRLPSSRARAHAPIHERHLAKARHHSPVERLEEKTLPERRARLAEVLAAVVDERLLAPAPGLGKPPPEGSLSLSRALLPGPACRATRRVRHEPARVPAQREVQVSEEPPRGRIGVECREITHEEGDSACHGGARGEGWGAAGTGRAGRGAVQREGDEALVCGLGGEHM